MSRKPRFNLTGMPQHVVQRGHNREPCFYAVDDYLRYLDNLREAAEKNQVRLHAYVLMTNHVHLLVTPEQPYGITQMMQDTGRKFVRNMNLRYQRTGSLWEGRFRASLVDSDAYLLTCMRYIELNPVRAGMVEHPGGYRWSSYAVNAGKHTDDMISPHALYLALGPTVQQRKQAYRELFRSYLAPAEVQAVREALNQELVLGREGFKDRIEVMIGRQTRPGKSGRPRIREESGEYYFSSILEETVF